MRITSLPSNNYAISGLSTYVGTPPRVQQKSALPGTGTSLLSLRSRQMQQVQDTFTLSGMSRK